MKTHNIYLIAPLTVALSILLIIPERAKAQDLRSAYFIDNYTYSYRLNPAFSTQRNFLGALISNLNAGTNSDIGVSTLLYPYNDKLVSFMHKSVDRDEFLAKLKQLNRIDVHVNHNIASAGFWTTIKEKPVFQTFEINMRNATTAKIPYNLFSFLKGGNEDNFFYDLSNVYGYTHTYLEIASGTSAKFGKLSVGARAKLLIGTNKISLKVDEMFANLDGSEWAIRSNAILRASGGGVKQELMQGALGEYDVLRLKNIKFKPLGFGGMGGAIDLGIKYEINQYINVSAAVNDLGFIVWRNKVNGLNDWNTFIIHKEETDVIGNMGTIFNEIVNRLKSVYEFVPMEKNYTSQSLSLNLHAGAEFKMPFYNKMSIGVLGVLRNSNINRYKEVRFSLNATPLKWLSLSANTAYTTFGWEYGGMVNIYAKKFSIFAGTDSYYFKMTPQLIPIDNCNTHVVFGVNYLLTRNIFK